VTEPIMFIVDGTPRAKQSFNYTKNGGGYTSPQVKEWQNTVRLRARNVMALAGIEPIRGEVAVRLVFVLKTKRVIDCDNLSKAVLDSLKNIVFEDDTNVVNLHIVKHVKPKARPGVFIEVHPGGWLPFGKDEIAQFIDKGDQ